ncbi:ABC transporter substrate-binding protein [Nitrosomonas marina]|uniref:Amino acid/amide ABC transporter substrate-binding protein, HAAT family n=1 Tax=Nitrosomonas marina TaxID=917 RepID=A0A1H8G3H6_9PROT|nr:penicillin-binding protein activator [Nitrosomonas marina]SEN38439.1 amino acid/amide ABC transporter substrate-binding protein, HAAT family [Nitrosomonas marina]
MKINNKLAITLLVLIFLTLGIFLLYNEQEQQLRPNSKEVVIGAVLPMTGDAGTFGQNAARGIELAILEANKSNLTDGHSIIKLAIEDSRGNAADALSAANKLIDVDHARFIVGDVTSAGTHAIIPVITRKKIPTISPSASDPALSGASLFFARVWPSDVYEAHVIATHAIEKNYSKIAIIYANTDYGVGMMKAFHSNIPESISTVDIPVDRGLVDFRPTLKRIQRNNVNALFVVSYPEDAKRLLGQIEEMRIELPILATATFEDPMVASSPGAEKIVFASPVPPDDKNKTRATFINEYRENFETEPGVLSDTGYDAAMLLIRAMAASGDQTPEKIIQFIRDLNNYQGASGIMSFDKNGDVQKTYGLKTVSGGSFVWLEKNN